MKLFRSDTPSSSRSAAADQGTPQGLVLFQIDDFEPLETLFGDLLALEVIEQVERRLMPRLPRGAALWRPERGRFALSVPDSAEKGVSALARDLKDAVARVPLTTSAGGVMISLSAGCSVAEPQHINLLGPAAQRALEMARSAGRARMRLVPAEYAVETDEQIVAKAVDAIDKRRIFLDFQPVVRVGPEERIAFHECTARLPDDGAPATEAARLLPLLTQSGQAHRLDRLVLSQALDVLAAHPAARLSVNVAAATIRDPEWLAIWDCRRRAQPELVERLIVEISPDAVFADQLATGSFLEQLRAGGSALALDGLDAGRLDADHLAALRFDIAKLAPAMTVALGDAAARGEDIGAVLDLVRKLDLMMVAQNVDSAAQATALEAQGIGYAQGRFYGLPDASPQFAHAAGWPGAATANSTYSESASRAASASR